MPVETPDPELQAAINWVKRRGIPIGRLMAIVNRTRQLDADLVRTMEDGVVRMSGHRVTAIEAVAQTIEEQIARSKVGRKFHTSPPKTY